jgi:solute carrier family 25 thiamine pyrophosphate transporter 19
LLFTFNLCRYSVAPAAYSSLSGAIASIAAREGVRGLYKGLMPGLVKSAPASAITFAVYEVGL